MKGVILAAGKGTRMREITQDIPKPMLLLANKPLLENTLGALQEAGVSEMLIVVQYRKEKIIEHFGNGKQFGVTAKYVEQPAMKGTGEAARLAKGFAGTDDFLLIFGDIVTPKTNIKCLVDEFLKHKPFLTLAVRHVADPWNGAAVYVKDGVVEKIIEKPKKGTSTTNYDNAGIFIFSNGIFEILENLPLSPRGEYELTDAIQTAIDRKLAVRAYELHGYWSNVSSPEDLVATNSLVLKEMKKTSVISEKAKIGENCKIGTNVSIADGAVVGQKARISNSIISRGAIIGDNAVLEYVFVPEKANVGKGAILKGIADKVLIV